jgi:hypothetical protein
MSSRLEFEKILNRLPPRPYEPTAYLRDLHRFFHEASNIDESVPYSFTAGSTREEIKAFADRLNSHKPTKRKQALDLIDQINGFVEDHLFEEGMGTVLEILLKTYMSHSEPGELNHKF